jgi:hypothetical protein
MKTTCITTSCISCREEFVVAKHLRLCDKCLDARLADLERTRRWSVRLPQLEQIRQLAYRAA